MRVCGVCGADVEAGGRFCPSCGAQLPVPARNATDIDRPSGTGDRRVTTVLFTDLVDSTSLAERLDPERLRIVLDRYFAAARTAIGRHGGVVEKFIGDAVVAVFGLPAVREDDALRAVRAAIDLHRAVEDLGRGLASSHGFGLAVRSGIETGEVLAGDASGDALVTGDVVNLAARLQQAASLGEILLGPGTHRLVRHAARLEPAGPLTLKGRSASVDAHRVLGLIEDAEALARKLDGPFVGRLAEIEALSRSVLEAEREPGCRARTVVGAPGVGKSRLVHEFLGAARARATILRGRCLPYGDGITWWPLVEVLHAAAGVTAADDSASVRRRLAGLIEGVEHADLIARRLGAIAGVVDEPAPPQELAWAVRRLLEHLAHSRPVVVVIDDIQWAESVLLDLLEHVADRIGELPVVLLFIARPELDDVRPGWLDGRRFHGRIRLEPLDEESTADLLESLAGDSLPPAARARILEAADGNPLFLEQIVAMLADEGILRPFAGGWTLPRDLDGVTIPPTIGALLAARLERLGEGERATIERASVVGKVFWWGSVSDLTPPVGQPAVGGHLATLVRRELIRPDTTGPDATIFPGDEAFRFRHLLVRDAAYARLPKAARADLHERFAAWLEHRAGRGEEFVPILGYHLEQAVRNRRELGLDDERTAGLAARAARYLGAAGRAGIERGEAPSAVNLLTRAVDLERADVDERREQLLLLTQALWMIGKPRDAEARLAELEAAVHAVPSERWELTVRLRRADRAHFAGEQGSSAALEAVCREVLAAWERVGDPALGARAWELLGSLAVQRGSLADEDRMFDEVVRLAELAGDRLRVNSIRFKRTNRAPGGLRPVPEGIALCRSVLADPGSSLQLRTTARIALGWLYGLDDRLHDARRELGEARRMAEDLGEVFPHLAADWPAAASWVERWFGDPALAEGFLRESVSLLREARDHWHLANAAPLLAEAIVVQPDALDARRTAEVVELVELGRGVSLPEDAGAQYIWRSVQARLASWRGNHREAVEMGREAVAFLDAMDDLMVQIEGQLLLVDLHRAAGDAESARQAALEALELARRKQAAGFIRLATEAAEAIPQA